MTQRAQPFDAAPETMRGFISLSNAVAAGGLEKGLLELVKIRASQLNGCANCLNMHTAEARRLGETEQRLHLLAAWRDAPCYSQRERAALAWTEALTLLAGRGVADGDYATLDAVFDKQEQAKLTMAIIVINGWNRLAVGFSLYDPSLGW